LNISLQEAGKDLFGLAGKIKKDAFEGDYSSIKFNIKNFFQEEKNKVLKVVYPLLNEAKELYRCASSIKVKVKKVFEKFNKAAQTEQRLTEIISSLEEKENCFLTKSLCLNKSNKSNEFIKSKDDFWLESFNNPWEEMEKIEREILDLESWDFMDPEDKKKNEKEIANLREQLQRINDFIKLLLNGGESNEFEIVLD
jgi:hypothetical protein